MNHASVCHCRLLCRVKRQWFTMEITTEIADFVCVRPTHGAFAEENK